MLNIIHFPIVTRFKCIVYYHSNNIQLCCVRVFLCSFFTNDVCLLFQMLQLDGTDVSLQYLTKSGNLYQWQSDKDDC